METPYIEKNCTFTHEGRAFESGGVCVTNDFLIAYLAKDNVLTSWHGEPIGKYRVLSTWRTPRSYGSSTYSSVECFVDNRRYVGRSAGISMIVKAKRSERKR